jgi:hypothetical protein
MIRFSGSSEPGGLCSVGEGFKVDHKAQRRRFGELFGAPQDVTNAGRMSN